MVELCYFGCGKEGTTRTKSGRACCSEQHQQCSEVRRKNAVAHAGLSSTRGQRGWSSGLTAQTDPRVKRNAEMRKGLPFPDTFHPTGKGRTPELEEQRIKKQKETVRRNRRTGGYRPGSGRGKSGWYKEIWCDSSWELAWVLYRLDNDLPFARNTQRFTYTHEGREFRYIPDFIADGEFVEIKGYEDAKWPSKLTQFPHKLLVIGPNEIHTFLEHAVARHGKDFIKLYGGVRPMEGTQL